MNRPIMLDTFMYALMKTVSSDSLMDFIECWGISKEEYEELKKWFKDELDIKL